MAGHGEAILFETDAKGERIVEKSGRKPDDVRYKEATRPLRWAVVVGTVDFRAIRRAMPAPPPDAQPGWPCKRVDLVRQSRVAGGGWTEWEEVDADANLDIIDNATQIEAERIRPDALLEAFVDPLPFLVAGTWRGVDVESLVDEKLRDVPRRSILTVRPGPRPRGEAADEVLVRSIDFTVKPGSTYRYRARVVATDPGPHADEINGPWSGPTIEVTIPK